MAFWLLFLLALTPLARAQSIEMTGTDGQGTNSYSNCVPRLETRRAWQANRSMQKYLGVQALSFEQSAHQQLAPRPVFYIIRHESGFNPSAGSSAGAQGLMQLMPETARYLGVENPLDPVQNVAGGSRYFAEQYARYRDVALALSAYNAGPTAVASHGGIPEYRETQGYVSSICAEYLRRRRKRR
jgi:soluble lytic murein transglycosylase-like protein